MTDDEVIRRLVRRAHDTDPEQVEVNIAAGLSDVRRRARLQETVPQQNRMLQEQKTRDQATRPSQIVPDDDEDDDERRRWALIAVGAPEPADSVLSIPERERRTAVNDLLNPPPDDGPGRPTRAAKNLTGHPPESVSAPDGAAVAAFAAFYRAQTPALVRFLVWMGARLPDAADLAQDTMIEAFNNWQTIEHPRTWIRRVASRKYVRRLAGTEEPVDPLVGRPLPPVPCDLTDWEQHHEIRYLQALLPPRQRQVMAWTCDGYQPHEIAAELGITAEAVRSSLRLARRKLAQQLPAEDEPR